MSLDQDYPRMNRNLLARLKAVLSEVAPDLDDETRIDLALSINEMADKACDLDEITNRLLNEPHTLKEIAELLIAFELTTEQIRGHSDTIDGKLYEIADRLKGLPASVRKKKTSKR